MLDINLDNVIGMVINNRWTSQVEFLHRDFLDLVIAYRYPVTHQDGRIGYQLITDEIIAGTDITEKMLYDAAVKNYRGRIRTMTAMLHMFGYELEASQYDDKMYILTNPEIHFGAFGITQTKILDNHAMLLRSDLAIIPSSVHEVILIPFDEQMTSGMNQIISCTNHDVVDSVDVLSNHMYVYRRSTKTVEICQ